MLKSRKNEAGSKQIHHPRSISSHHAHEVNYTQQNRDTYSCNKCFPYQLPDRLQLTGAAELLVLAGDELAYSAMKTFGGALAAGDSKGALLFMELGLKTRQTPCQTRFCINHYGVFLFLSCLRGAILRTRCLLLFTCLFSSASRVVVRLRKIQKGRSKHWLLFYLDCASGDLTAPQIINCRQVRE